MFDKKDTKFMHDSVMVHLRNFPFKVSQDRVLKNFIESTNHHYLRRYVRIVEILLVARKTREIDEHKTLIGLTKNCRHLRRKCFMAFAL